jgi:multiple sugar transport system permease protein
MMNVKKVILESRWGYFFILPAYIFFTVFTLIPLLNGLLFSFYKVNFRKGNEWIGLDNYIKLFNDAVLWKAYVNTLKYVFIGVPLIVSIALLIAVLIFSLNKHFQTFVKMAFYLPVVAGGVVLAISWKYILDTSYGFLNYVIGFVGIEPIGWLGTPTMAFAMLIVILISMNLGSPIILFLAGLGAISPELYDASKVDGANKFRQFINITIPLLKQTTFFVWITQMIGVFQIFVVILMMTSGGPAYGTTSSIYYMFDVAFGQQNFGYASTIGVLMIISTSLFTFIFFKVFRDSSQFYR